MNYAQVLYEHSEHIFIGLDECGYGALAGDLTVCGVKAPRDWNLEGLNDSKKLSPKKRKIMSDKLKDLSYKGEISFAITSISNTDLDTMGVAYALKTAYALSIHSLYEPDVGIFVDGIINLSNHSSHQVTPVIKADTFIPTVMAASILGKVFRDEKMEELHKLYPQYDWASNKGYGSPKHMVAIKNGACKFHRFSYEPMKSMIKY